MRPFSARLTPCALAAAALSVGLAASTAHAAMIGINFIGLNNGGGASVTGTAGVVAQSNWNNDAGTSSHGSDSALILSDGTSAGSTVTWSANDPWSTAQAGQNQNGDLMQGYLDDTPTVQTSVTVSTLPSSIAGTGSTAYTVYLYIAGDTAGRGGTYTVNGQTATLVNSGPEADGVFKAASSDGAVAGNYYAFTNVTGTTLSITTTPTIGGANERSPIDAIQIVSGSPVPEPASLAFLSLAALPLLGRRRRA